MKLTEQQLDKVERVFEGITFVPEEPVVVSEMLRLLILNLCTWFFVRMGNEPAEVSALRLEISQVLAKAGLTISTKGGG